MRTDGLGLQEVSEESRTKRNFIPKLRGPENKRPENERTRKEDKRTIGPQDKERGRRGLAWLTIRRWKNLEP